MMYKLGNVSEVSPSFSRMGTGRRWRRRLISLVPCLTRPQIFQPAFDVPIVEDETVEEVVPWDLSYLTSKDDRGPSDLQRIQ